MKAKSRISNIIKDRHVMPQELATRFLVDSNLHEIAFTCDISDGYEDFDQVLMIRKSHGKYVIQEYTINNNHHVVVSDNISVTHDFNKVISAIRHGMKEYNSTPTAFINQYGYYAAGLRVLQFAEK